MFDRFVEVSPDIFHKDITGADGFTKGIIHSSPSCAEIVGIKFSTFSCNRRFYSIKVGRGWWIRVRKDVRCPVCFAESGETGEEVSDVA